MATIDIEMWVKVEKRPREVLHLRDEPPISFRYEDGRVTVHVESGH
jgi:hypothetical protein